ncbi:MAG: hypothetical protein K0S08_526 [Gammaproteobacteria bacterium]|jgi:hypothetical protein|nr:hypothetical protein [Gammaproteobacteria bacterium]
MTTAHIATDIGLFSRRNPLSALSMLARQTGEEISSASSQSATDFSGSSQTESVSKRAEQYFGRLPNTIELQLYQFAEKRLREQRQPELILKEVHALLENHPEHALTILNNILKQLDERAAKNTPREDERLLRDALENLKKQHSPSAPTPASFNTSLKIS